MRYLFVITIFLLSSNSFAKSSDYYCRNETLKVYVAMTDNNKKAIPQYDVITAELIANLKDGTAVVVRCDSPYGLYKKKVSVESAIVKQSNIFTPMHGRVDGHLVIGANFKDHTILSFDSTIPLWRKYRIRNSPYIADLVKEGSSSKGQIQ